MISDAAYPNLRNFVGCTFHQDWDEVAETFRGVAHARRKSPPRGRRAASRMKRR